MYKNRYSFSGYIFEIDALYEFFSKYSKEYITEGEPDFVIVDKQEELDEWINTHNEIGPKDYIETLLIQTKVAELLVKYNVFIFHGSAIYLDNKNNGYIFTGPSGVGKSTHVKLLQDTFQNKLTIINDDKPFVDASYNIYGSPWSGKSHISSNVTSKLKGVFVLYQSKDNMVEKLSSKDAISYLTKQIYIPKGVEESNKGLEFLINLVKDIPIYNVGLNLDKDAYKITSQIMLGDNNED